MKVERQSAILRIIREQRISNQDALRLALAALGLNVAQATLSRDIRELGLVKQVDPGGGGFYAAPAEGPARPDFSATLATWLVSYEGVGPLLVLRTVPGGATPVALAMEHAGWTEVIGALPGGDNVLVVTRSEMARKAVERHLEKVRQGEAR
jgi:transcriptional regulator of arginine metabolism